MTIGPSPVCLKCIHYNEDDYSKLSCAAFPQGIPDEIILGGNKHLDVLPGQENDLIFTPIPKVKK